MTETAKPVITSIPKKEPEVKDWMTVKRVSERKKGEGGTWLNYGPAGSGKTFFGGTAGERTLIIDNGAGLDTLQSPLFTSKYKDAAMYVTVAEEMSERGVFDTAKVFDEICDVLDYYLANHADKFDTVVIDDVTQLRKGAMNKALELNQATRKSKTLTDVVRKYDIVSPAVQDYGVEMNLIEQFVASYTTICKEAEKNLIMNAHERLVFGKPSSIGEQPPLLKTMPGFTGQSFPDAVSAYFDNVWYFQAVGGGSNRVYRITTQGHEALTAKTRWGGVFETVETNPNFLSMQQRIKDSTPENMKRKK